MKTERLYRCWLDALLRSDGTVNLVLSVQWQEDDPIYVLHNAYLEVNDPLFDMLSTAANALSFKPENLHGMVDLPDDCEIDVRVHPYSVKGTFGWYLHAWADVPMPN